MQVSVVKSEPSTDADAKYAENSENHLYLMDGRLLSYFLNILKTNNILPVELIKDN